MNIKSYTIFSKKPRIPSSKTDKNTEDRKISYWLKKLFTQRAQKVTDDKKLEESKLTSQSKGVGENAPLLKSDGESFEQKGSDEVTQSFSAKNVRDKRQTEEMVRKSNREVFSISTVFPWQLFPTTIRIQENKVSFIFRQFLSSQEQDVDIKDISNTHIELSFFFAKLKVISNTFANQPVIVDSLRKKDAQRARMYIQGLQLFNQKNIDTSDYEIKELIQKLEELQTDKYHNGKKKKAAGRIASF
ncbi:MAG: hypothetical protein Q8P26_01785 [Candidatus Levybacteria bacterium]|nr:hypothetical protein [Candidatus Levybacteria bacterium]